jgi:hypothetical protein
MSFKTPLEAYFYLKLSGNKNPEALELISKDLMNAYNYAQIVVKGRFPQGEAVIRTFPLYWNAYLENICQNHYSEKDKLKWLKEEGFTNELFAIFNFLGCGLMVQRYVLKKRPDLIGKIQNLHPTLKAKCQHEVELSRVDL